MRTTAFLTAILIFLAASIANAQLLNVSTYIEKTHISPKVGTAITYEFSNMIEVGGFFQQSTSPAEAEYGRPTMKENDFAGISMSFPIMYSDRAMLKLNTRTGLVNLVNFAITPSLHGEYALLPRLVLVGGVGVRSFRPTWQAAIKFSL